MERKPKHFPETLPAQAPADMEPHLLGTYQRVFNEIQGDQRGIQSCLDQIKAVKGNIRFFKKRIIANHHALEALGAIKSNRR